MNSCNNNRFAGLRSLNKMFQVTRAGALGCSFICPKYVKTLLRASANSKSFSGGYTRRHLERERRGRDMGNERGRRNGEGERKGKGEDFGALRFEVRSTSAHVLYTSRRGLAQGSWGLVDILSLGT
jgi:hypothetical protein